MTKLLLVYAIGLFLGMAAGFYLGIAHMIRRSSDGICIRANDGEAYLRISEAGQKKLLDPYTKLLYIRVVDVSTRNKQTL